VIPRDFIKEAVFDQEKGCLTIIFQDGTTRLLEYYKNYEEIGVLYFR